jgi:uncharacterized OB-fold protein
VTSPPVPDEDSAPYWDALREHRLRLQKCANCGEVRFPPMPGCPNCGSPESKLLFGAGTGEVYSWIVVRRPFGTFTEADLPAVIATVELDEGCRVLGRLHTTKPVSAGLRVVARYVDHDEWTELAFDPVGS